MNNYEKSIIARQYRKAMLNDPYRPGYHFAVPDGNGIPGDPNGAFFGDGRYHLMYLYKNGIADAYHWGHISSLDLLHWREHPDAVVSLDGDGGGYSGGAFVDEDETAYLTFWKFPNRENPTKDQGGIDMVCARPPYDTWERVRPMAISGSAETWGTVDIEKNGVIYHVGCADPSNIWKMNGHYYMLTGNCLVLDKWGREPDSDPYYKGDWNDLFRSDDLKTWKYVHRFYKNPHTDADYPDETEDNMCPTILKVSDKPSGGDLGDKYLLTFIAHNKGAQYYVGEIKDETFYPEAHGRFSWKDCALFAPEALLDNKNRHIVWYWMRDFLDRLEKDGWSGIYTFPRVLWYNDGVLHMAPAEELECLQYHPQKFELGTVSETVALDVKNGASFRLRATVSAGQAKKVGFAIRANKDAEYTLIYVDTEDGKLVMDMSHSDTMRRCLDGSFLGRIEEAPFVLEKDETITFDIFVDKSIAEVYVNERQAIARCIYPDTPNESVGVRTFVEGQADFGTVDVWEMSPANQY